MNRIILPIPPSVNHYLGKTKRGFVFKTKVAKLWEADAKRFASLVWTKPMLEEKCVMNVWVFWPDNRRRDVGNLEKCLSDALTGVVWIDDKYVLPRFQDYCVDKLNPRIEVEVEKFGHHGTHKAQA